MVFLTQNKKVFSPQNVTKFHEILNNIDITPILIENNTNSAYELLMSNNKTAFNQCFPLTQQHCKTINNQPWFDKDLYIYLWLIKTNFLKNM